MLGLNSFLFLRAVLLQGRLMVRQRMLIFAYIWWELELCMFARVGNISLCILLPFLCHSSLLPIFPILQPWKDRAHPVHTAVRQEVKCAGGKQLPAKRRPSLLSLPHSLTCISCSEEFISNFQLHRRARWPSFLWGNEGSVAFGSPSCKTMFSLEAAV